MFQQEFQVFTPQEQDKIINEVLCAQTEWQNAKINPYHYKDTDLSWRYHTATCSERVGDHPMFALRLVQRLPDDKPGFVCSPHWLLFEKVFHRAREKMGFPFSQVLRASINCTWHHPAPYGVVHKDHYSKPHYNMILQLTPTTAGGTFIFDDNKELVGESDVAQWSATAFEGLWHAGGFPAPGETRIICVITWE